MDFTNFFGGQLNIQEVTLEVYIGSALVERQLLSMPQFALEQQFKQLMAQIMDDERPMKIRYVKDEPIYDEMNNYVRTLQKYVEYENKILSSK